MTVAISGGGLPSEGNDTLVGTSGNDFIYLMGGDDRYSGLDGSDTIVGGAGVDLLFGNADFDTFILRAGDTAPGEVINGGNGVDTIQIDGGGTVSFNGMRITAIESITLNDLSGTTLDLSGLIGDWASRTALASSITRAVGTADEVKFGVWHADFTALNAMYDAGVETVSWTDTQGITFSAQRQLNGQIVTDMVDTTDAVGWSSLQLTQDADGTIRGRQIIDDDFRFIEVLFDDTGQMVSQSVEDLSDAHDFRSLTRSFIDGVLSELDVTSDTGIHSTYSFAPNGDRTSATIVDAEDSQNWDTRVVSYLDGVITQIQVTYDAGDNRTGATEFFVNGVRDSTVVNYDDGRIHVIGNDGDNIIESTGARETLVGKGGADTFLFKTGVGVDIITDFEDGVDMLDFNTRGIDSRADLESKAFLTQFGADLEIAFISGDNILMYNVTKAQIDDSDFVVNPPLLVAFDVLV